MALLNQTLRPRPRPRLSKEFNGPPTNRTHARTRDYYDATSLQYPFSVGNGLSVFDPGNSVRLIDSLKVTKAKNRFKQRVPTSLRIFSAAHSYQQVDTAFKADLSADSTPVCFDEYQRQFSAIFWQSVRAGREKSGYIIFDRQSKRIFFEPMPVASSLNEAVDPYRAGEYYRGNKVLANVHTHPGEIPFLKQGISDASIYDAQYSQVDSDGSTAVIAKTARYTIGRFNIDFFSPDGRAASKNNVASVQALTSGNFNIYKHALEVSTR